MIGDQLKITMHELAELVCVSDELESTYLYALAAMEDVAAREILKSISELTPDAELRSVLAHAQDEQRHGHELRAMRPLSRFTDVSSYHLQDYLAEIMCSFPLGFFSQKKLRDNRRTNRHAAYVHSARSIEEAPFHIYSSYLRLSRVPKVRERLPAILRDENDHLELGSRLYQTLPVDQRLSIDELVRLEMEMCELMGRKLIRALQTRSGTGSRVEPSFESRLVLSLPLLSAWIHAAALILRDSGRPEFADAIEEAMLFAHEKLKRDPGYLATSGDFYNELLGDPSPAHAVRESLARISEFTPLVGLSFAIERAGGIPLTTLPLTPEGALSP